MVADEPEIPHPGYRWNVCIEFDRRVFVRLGIRTTRDETLDLLPLAEDPEVGLVFFATLLPQPAALLSIQGFGDDGEPLPEPAPAPTPAPHLPPMTADPAGAPHT